MSTLSKIQLDKRRFVHRMGPYYRQASAEGDASLERFLQSIFRHYCDRWPLDRRDYPDLDVMKAYLEVERTLLNKSIQSWAGLSVFDTDRHWSQLFRYKEASDDEVEFVEPAESSKKPANKPKKLGSKENPIDVDNQVIIRPPLNRRPRPRPRARANTTVVQQANKPAE